MQFIFSENEDQHKYKQKSKDEISNGLVQIKQAKGNKAEGKGKNRKSEFVGVLNIKIGGRNETNHPVNCIIYSI